MLKAPERGGLRVSLLATAPELGERLPRRDRERAMAVEVPSLHLARGPMPPASPALRQASFGALIGSGLIARRVEAVRGQATMLYSRGDLIRPRHDPVASLATSSWTVVESVEVLLLDARAAIAVAAHPSLVLALVELAQATAERAGVQLALSNLPRLKQKLHGMLWLLAQTWGGRDGSGWLVPFGLTQELIAALVGAHRPSVSVAMRELREEGAIVGGRTRWRVLRPPW